jgi:hypothetical protein
MLLIALLATDNLSETGSQTEIFAGLKSEAKQSRCPLTGQETFASAIAAALASEDSAKRVKWIRVNRGERHAGIVYKARGSERLTLIAIELLSEGRDVGQTVSRFGSEGFTGGSGLYVGASLHLDFVALAHDLKEAKK